MIDFLNENKVKIIIIAVGILAIIIGIYIYVQNNNYEEIEQANVFLQETNENKEQTKENEIVIHMAGEVNNPGIVKLIEGSRIEDAINKAGGLKETADITNVNLAYILEDGVKITIPNKENINDVKIIDDTIGFNSNYESENLKENKLVNINKATSEQLQKVTGIGPSLASKIVEYRKVNGKFSKIEDIKNVGGIGDSKYENLKDEICAE